MARVAVLQIPGVNCEYETKRVLEAVGLGAAIVRFNEPSSSLASFDAFVLPGGFAYQDRIRAGAVAAKLPAVERIAQESESGKPVLGICNGAQVLVEAGLVPGLHKGAVEVALAPNKAPRRQGYLCRWVRVRAGEGPGAASDLRARRRTRGAASDGTARRFETARPAVQERIETGLALPATWTRKGSRPRGIRTIRTGPCSRPPGSRMRAATCSPSCRTRSGHRGSSRFRSTGAARGAIGAALRSGL
jgi:putative intracellular protease/amidase